MRRLHALPLVLLALCTPVSLTGQEAPPKQWDFQVELGFNGAKGNSSFSILRTGARAKHLRTDVAEIEASVLVRYGENEEKVIADDAKATLKADLWPKARWSPFVFADVGRDKIRSLDLRFSGGAGGKWTFWSGESGKASVSVAALYDFQNFASSSDGSQPESESLARWSVRHKVEKTLSSSASFEQVVFYQPVWDHGSDYVLDMTNSVSTKLMANLSLAVEHEYLRDSTPPPGVGKDDQRFSVILKMSF